MRARERVERAGRLSGIKGIRVRVVIRVMSGGPEVRVIGWAVAHGP
jgi:hypothetical protein